MRICRSCGPSSAPGRWNGRECPACVSVRTKAWKASTLAAGKCVECGQPAKGRRCDVHAARHSAREKVKYAVDPNHRQAVIERARAYHLATYVPKPPRPPGKGRDLERRKLYVKAWKLAHPERIRELGVHHRQLRRARMAKAEGKFTPEDWRRVVVGQESRCFDCGERCKLTIGHLRPIVRGGRHSPENIVGQCRRCNSVQGQRIHPILLG